MGDHRAELQRPDVLGVMDGIRVVGLVRGDGVRVVVHACDHLRYFLPAQDGHLTPGGRAAGAAEEVDVKETYVFVRFHNYYSRLLMM